MHKTIAGKLGSGYIQRWPWPALGWPCSGSVRNRGRGLEDLEGVRRQCSFSPATQLPKEVCPPKTSGLQTGLPPNSDGEVLTPFSNLGI